MTSEQRQLDPIEEALLELNAAEKARLFRQSRVDAKRLVAKPVPTGWRWRTLRLVSAAAVIAAAVGMWSWLYGLQWSQLRERTGTSVVVESSPADPGRFQECFHGPTGAIRSSCGECDYDADGDVDLADFSAYQLAYASVTH